MATKQNQNEEKFQELCEYVKKEIMGYDKNQKLTKHMILRLRGASEGKFIANKVTAPMAHYPFDVILLTFKYIKPRLDDIMRTKTFNSEEHKFNYIMIIMSNNINLVYNKVKKIKEEQRRVKQIEATDLPNYNNKYIKPEGKNVDTKLEKFW